MLTYGTDKPDLRNPLLIKDVSEVFKGSDFGIFANMVEQGGFVRGIKTPGTASRPRSWFDKMNAFAVEKEMGGLGYITFTETENKGPIAKKLDEARINRLKEITEAGVNDTIFFICGKGDKVVKFAGQVRTLLGNLSNPYQCCNSDSLSPHSQLDAKCHYDWSKSALKLRPN